MIVESALEQESRPLTFGFSFVFSEPDGSALGFGRRHESPDGVEDGSKLCVVLLFEDIETFCEFGVIHHEAAKTYECFHHGDSGLYRCVAVEHVGQHDGSVFSESIGRNTASTSAWIV